MRSLALMVLIGCTGGTPAAEPVAMPNVPGIDVPKNLAGPAEADAPAAVAPAADCAEPPNCRKWSFRVIPYGWIAGAHGDLTVRNVTAPVDVSIGKATEIVVNNLDFAFAGQIEATNGRFGVIVNGLYADVSPGRRIRNLNFSTDLATTILDVAATVNVDSVAEALRLPSGSRFELLAGFRYLSLSSGITVTGPRGNTASDSGTEDWIDPIIGARLRIPLRNCLTAQVRGDIGGFDFGDSSRFTWNIEATLEYRWSERFSILAGYRVLDIDRVSGSGSRRFQFDMNLNGPVLGFAFGF